MEYNSWRNINRWVRNDLKVVFNSTPRKIDILAPSFGLKVVVP